MSVVYLSRSQTNQKPTNEPQSALTAHTADQSVVRTQTQSKMARAFSRNMLQEIEVEDAERRHTLQRKEVVSTRSPQTAGAGSMKVRTVRKMNISIDLGRNKLGRNKRIDVNMEKLWALQGGDFERKYTDRSNLTTISEGLESLPASPEQLFLSRTWSTIHKDVADEFKTAVVNTLRFIDLESSGMDMYQ